jgi:hypothetical protein
MSGSLPSCANLIGSRFCRRSRGLERSPTPADVGLRFVGEELLAPLRRGDRRGTIGSLPRSPTHARYSCLLPYALGEGWLLDPSAEIILQILGMLGPLYKLAVAVLPEGVHHGIRIDALLICHSKHARHSAPPMTPPTSRPRPSSCLSEDVISGLNCWTPPVRFSVLLRLVVAATPLHYPFPSSLCTCSKWNRIMLESARLRERACRMWCSRHCLSKLVCCLRSHCWRKRIHSAS